MILTVSLKSFDLQFKVLETPLAKLWVDRMNLRHAYPLDDPERFYGFNSLEQDKHKALTKINACIDQIKVRHPHLDRGHVTDVNDQDNLNFWHHVFEIYHGLLNQEDRSDPLVSVLADLNLAVHRCESVARGNRPRFVCTWYGLPKTHTLDVTAMEKYGTLNPGFGTVCLNYAEIGKTLEDLTHDRDNYINDEAFRPFNHYSADFSVRMFNESSVDVNNKMLRMKDYFQRHRKFFSNQGYESFDDPRLLPLRFPVAELITNMNQQDLLDTISQQQYITQVTLV